MRCLSLVSVFVSGVLTLAASHACAQALGSKPVRIISPYAAGGTNDVIARIVGQKLAEVTGRAFIVENPATGEVLAQHGAWARVPIASITIRVCPELPPTTEQRIADHRAQTFADSVMYREALAAAAEARGWSVHWYNRESVFRDAAAVLGCEDVDAFLHAMGRSIGPPWQATHKLAAAAALAATAHPAPRPTAG